MRVMTVKEDGKDTAGASTGAVPSRRDDSMKDTDARGRVETPPEVAAAVEASKDAFEHMLEVVTEATTVRQGVTSDMDIRARQHRGPVTHEALAAFVGAVEEIAGEKGISVEAARRGGLLAAATTAWEDALGPQLDTTHVRELLGGVSKQRINELLQQHRLIGMKASNARWQFPAFQFADGRLPVAKLAEAFWQLSTRAVDPWSAASWCVSPNPQLDGRTPAEVATTDAELVAAVGERDADRLSR